MNVDDIERARTLPSFHLPAARAPHRVRADHEGRAELCCQTRRRPGLQPESHPMKFSRLACVLLAAAAPVLASTAVHAALPRFPQPYGDRIVFVADGNIWSVDKNGGAAERLTSAPGQDMFPRVSPDGKWIAYTEASKAGTDVWVIPAWGGPARRLTFHPTTEAGTGGRHGPDNMVVTWTPDSQEVVYLTKKDQWNSWIQYMYKVPVAGGAPTSDADRQRRWSGELRPRRPHHRLQPHLPEFPHLEALQRRSGAAGVHLRFRHPPADPAHRTGRAPTPAPMWYGRQDLLPVRSGREPAGQHLGLSTWTPSRPREVTHFTDYDIDFPALGGDAIAFQQGGKLWLLDLPSEQLREVPLTACRTTIRAPAPHVDRRQGPDPRHRPGGAGGLRAGAQRQAHACSPLAAISSACRRKTAPTRDLTGTQDADEDHPTWSPDGKTIAYTTDVGGGQDRSPSAPPRAGRSGC